MTPTERAKVAALTAATRHGVHADVLEHITNGGSRIPPHAIDAMIRAAMQELRMPSIEMIEAAQGGPGQPTHSVVTGVWVRMIDAALGEAPTP
jgi:hypothetical protein